MIGNSNYIGTSLNGWIQKLSSKVINPIQFFKNNYLNKNDRTTHWVGHSKLKELYIYDFFKIKQMNEEMEAELTGMYSKTDNLGVTEEANVDEDIPIDLIKEQSIQVYKETTSMNIENINTFEARNKVNTIKQRPILKVIDEAYFKGSKMFSNDFIK